MAKSLPPMTWFRAFEAAARHLSFTRAAEELSLTQSAVSQHVRALEERLGQQLFVRAHRTLQLTDAGRLMLPDVALAIQALGNATARYLPQTDQVKLKVATSASIAQHVIAPQIARFHREHPDIAVEIVTTVWPDDFATTKADVEIRFGAASVVGRGAELLLPSQLHAVATPEVAAGGIDAAPLIQPVGISLQWSDLIKDRSASLFVDTHGMAVDLALGGAGVALAHGLITRRAVEDGRLVDMGLGIFPAKEGFFLALNATDYAHAQQAFAVWLREALQ